MDFFYSFLNDARHARFSTRLSGMKKCSLCVCEKVRKSECILVGTFAPERSEDEITFSLVYRTQFFYTTCTNLDLAHALLFQRAQNRTLRTECEKNNFKIHPLNNYKTM